MKTYAGSDIEVAVLTRDRTRLLKEALDSLAAQTVKGLKITVYDNAGSEDSGAVVSALRAENPSLDISHFRHEKNVGFDGNFKNALDCASRDFIILAHDDDIFHPRYVEYVLKAANRFGNVALVNSRCIHETPANPEEWRKKIPSTDAFLFETYRDLSAYYAAGGQAIFASAAYRTEYIRRELRPNLCGKIGDTNFLVDCARGGKAVVFLDGDLFFSRVHPGQDSCNLSNGPYENEILALHNYFKEILTTSPKLYHRFVFQTRYAERFLKFLKFSGMKKRDALKILGSLNAKGVDGIFFRLYATPVVGGFVRFALRLLNQEKKLHWPLFKIRV